MKLECLTHRVTVTAEGNKREFQTPPGSWRGMPTCRLMLLAELKEGTYGKCVVQKVE